MDTIQVVVYLVLWAIACSFLLVGVRVTAGKELNTFRHDGSDLSTFGLRATRALGNNLDAAAAKTVKVAADGLNSDIHASAEYRAHLISIMASRAAAAA